MPIELKTTTSRTEEAEKPKALVLFNENREPTLPCELLVEFLETCDYSALFASPDVVEFQIAEDGDEEEDEDGEKEEGQEKDEESDDEEEDEASEASATEVLISGVVAAQHVDEDDLVDMFGYYLGQVSEEEHQPLQRRAMLACFANLRSEDGGIAEASRKEVAEALREVLSASVVVGELDEKFLSKGARLKVSRKRKKPKTGARKRELRKRRREEGRGAKKAKIQRQKKAFKRRRSGRLKQLARESFDDQFVLGLGDGTDNAKFRVGLAEDPNFELLGETLHSVEEQCGMTTTCPNEECGHEAAASAFLSEEGLRQKQKATKKTDDGETSESLVCPECHHTFVAEASPETDDSKPEDRKDESRDGVPTGGPFACATGRPALNEGSSLAASTLASMGLGRKRLDEDAD